MNGYIYYNFHSKILELESAIGSESGSDLRSGRELLGT
jgi:hypothetical protein